MKRILIALLSIGVLAFTGPAYSQSPDLLPKLTKGNKKYDEIGSLDYVSDTKLVVSDSAYIMPKWVSCYDDRGRKDIGCFGLKKAKWVGLYLKDKVDPSALTVDSVYILTEKKYKALISDD